MGSKLLFIFEGEKTEAQILQSLQRFHVNENTTIKCIFGAEIYQIYKEINGDEYVDTFNLIKYRSEQNKDTLRDYNRNDFAEIYLFFDYDGHSSLADDNKMEELLLFFDEETDKGKLYVSYPMAESLKHLNETDDFKTLTINCKENVGYKAIVNVSCSNKLRHFKKYDAFIWSQLISAHLKKMNYIVNGSFSFPTNIISQPLIFFHQNEKYIKTQKTVAVLSAFPIFLYDYYGNEGIISRIDASV